MVAQLERIDQMIQARDDVSAVEHLELLSTQGNLSPDDRIALALMLMMPPFADYVAANAHLIEVCDTDSTFRTEAAVWGEYIFLHLHPDHDGFVNHLHEVATSAESCYMLACNAEFYGDLLSARASNERALSIRSFPNALLLAAGLSMSPSDRANYRREAESLVRVRDSEYHPGPQNRSDLRAFYWSELILGERITSVVWEHIYRRDSS